MKETAPLSKSQGIIAIAALAGLIATVFAFVIYDFGFFGGIFVGIIVAAFVAVVLMLGWRDAAHDTQDASENLSAPVPAPKPEAPVPATTPGPAPVPAPKAEAGKPALLDAARDGGPDNLKQIKGVGPKLEKTLHDMGIYHFDQIAAWGPDEQAWMDGNLKGFKGRATRDNWVAQAKTLAAGGATEFSSKVKKGGVY